MQEFPAEAWGVIGITISGLLVYLGTRFTAKSTRQAQRDEVEAEEDANAITGYARLVRDITEDRKMMRDRLDEQDTRIEAQNKKINELERRVEKFQRLYQNAIKYIVLLRRIIINEIPAYAIPEPPEGLMMDIDGGHHG